MISVIVLWDKRLLENPQICSWNKKGPLFTLSKLTEIWCRWSIFAIHREQGFRWPTLDQSSAGINKISIFHSRTQPDIIRVFFWNAAADSSFVGGIVVTLFCSPPALVELFVAAEKFEQAFDFSKTSKCKLQENLQPSEMSKHWQKTAFGQTTLASK